jgi:hypothetical protein
MPKRLEITGLGSRECIVAGLCGLSERTDRVSRTLGYGPDSVRSERSRVLQCRVKAVLRGASTVTNQETPPQPSPLTGRENIPPQRGIIGGVFP